MDGNGSGTEDETNLDKTFLRGLWKTDDEGVVQFQTIFPGHYQGRASKFLFENDHLLDITYICDSVHTHLVAHSGGYVNSNGTFRYGYRLHRGLRYSKTKCTGFPAVATLRMSANSSMTKPCALPLRKCTPTTRTRRLSCQTWMTCGHLRFFIHKPKI